MCLLPMKTAWQAPNRRGLPILKTPTKELPQMTESGFVKML